MPSLSSIPSTIRRPIRAKEFPALVAEEGPETARAMMEQSMGIEALPEWLSNPLPPPATGPDPMDFSDMAEKEGAIAPDLSAMAEPSGGKPDFSAYADPKTLDFSAMAEPEKDTLLDDFKGLAGTVREAWHGMAQGVDFMSVLRAGEPRARAAGLEEELGILQQRLPEDQKADFHAGRGNIRRQAEVQRELLRLERERPVHEANAAKNVPLAVKRMAARVEKMQAAGADKSPEMRAWDKAEGVEAWKIFASNPIEWLANMALGGAVSSLPAAAYGTVGAITAGPAGAATGVGLGSFAVEYANHLMGSLDKAGVDLDDPKAIAAALEDPKIAGPLKSAAAKRGLGVGAFDTIASAFGGKFLIPALRKGTGPVLRATGKELLAQGGLGGAGEATGSVLAGDPISGKAVAAEIGAEIFGGREAAQNIYGERRTAKAKAAKAETDRQVALAAQSRDRVPLADIPANRPGGSGPAPQPAQPSSTATPPQPAQPSSTATPAPIASTPELIADLTKAVEGIQEAITRRQIAPDPVPRASEELEQLFAKLIERDAEPPAPPAPAPTVPGPAIAETPPAEVSPPAQLPPQEPEQPQEAPPSPFPELEPTTPGTPKLPPSVAPTRSWSPPQPAKGRRTTSAPAPAEVPPSAPAPAEVPPAFPELEPPAAGTSPKAKAGGQLPKSDAPAAISPAASQAVKIKQPRRRQSTRGWDILDWIESFGRIRSKKFTNPNSHSLFDSDDYGQIMRGSARRFFAANGSPPDVVADAAHRAGVIGEPTADALWKAMLAAHRGRRADRAGASAEQSSIVREEAQHVDFAAEAFHQRNGASAIDASELLPGDTFTVDGVDMVVERLEYDWNTDDLSAVWVKDGKRFGVQRIADDQIIYGKNLFRPDRTGGNADFLPQEPEAPTAEATPPEAAPVPDNTKERVALQSKTGRTVQEEQRLRELEREAGQGELLDVETRPAEEVEAEKTKAEQRAEMERKAAARLTAGPVETQGDIFGPGPGQADVFEQALDSLKINIRPGDLHAFGVLPQLWNGMIDTIKNAYRRGKAIVQAIEDGIRWLKSQQQEAIDEDALRAHLNEKLAPQAKEESDRKTAIYVRIDEIDQELFWLRARGQTDQAAALREEKASLLAEFSALQYSRAPHGVKADPELPGAEMRFSGRNPVDVPPGAAPLSGSQQKLDLPAELAPPEYWEGEEEFQARQEVNLPGVVTDELAPESQSDLRLRMDMADLVREANGLQDAADQISIDDLTRRKADIEVRAQALFERLNQSGVPGIGVRGNFQAPAGAPTTASWDPRAALTEGATLQPEKTLTKWWRGVVSSLSAFASATPEIPVTGEKARFFSRFTEGYRLMKAASEAVRKQAEDDIAHIVKPINDLGRKEINPDLIKRFRRLAARYEQTTTDGGDPSRAPGILRELKAVQAQLDGNPWSLFQAAVVYRDLWFRSLMLTKYGKPVVLPLGQTRADISRRLVEISARIRKHPHQAEIEESLRRHYRLMAKVQAELLAAGEIIPEQMRNPLYFPHHVLEHFTGRLDRLKYTTEDDFRGYLIDPIGTWKTHEADYVKALYVHLANVRAHNARSALVHEYWQKYDIADEVTEAARRRSLRTGGDTRGWAVNPFNPANIPPGYKPYSPTKALPLRMDYIIDRETLSRELGVAVGDGDLRERLRESGIDLTVTADQLHQALVAGEKIRWLLPEEMVDALRGIERREKVALARSTGFNIGSIPRAITRGWKYIVLFWPFNWIRYEFNNTVTDLEKLWGVDPGISKHMRQALQELRDWRSGKVPTKELSEAFKRGVVSSVTINEIGGLADLKAFDNFLGSGELMWARVKRAITGTTRLSGARESLFRYAKFLSDVSRMRAGKPPIWGGAYWRDVNAIPGIYGRASYISRRTFGDYADVSVAGNWLRELLTPFFSWTDVNFRYHANLFRNLRDMIAANEWRHAGGIMTAQSVAAAGILARMATIYGIVTAWNTVGGVVAGLWDEDDDLENDLSAEDRRRFHLILGKDENGMVKIVYVPTALGDVAEWVGGNDFARLFGEYTRGQITLDQFASDWVKRWPLGVLNKMAGSIGPVAKAGYIALSGKNPFPDVTDQRTISEADFMWVLAQTLTDRLAVEGIRSVVDKDFYPRSFRDWAQQTILQVRRRDPDQWAYYEIREKAADWHYERTGRRRDTDYTAPDQVVLRNFRKAVYRGDLENALRFHARATELGYTTARWKSTLAAQEPLSTLPKADRKAFVAQLSPTEQAHLGKAFRYFARLNAAKDEGSLFPRRPNGTLPADAQERLRRSMQGAARLTDEEVKAEADRLQRISVR